MMTIMIGQGAPLTPKEEQNAWPYKAVVATRGNQTIIGTILLQVIGKAAKNAPIIHSTATVDENGLAWVNMTVRGDRPPGLYCLGKITDIRDEFRRLADHLKLDDGERIEMFDELRKWVAVDLRADHDELKKVR